MATIKAYETTSGKRYRVRHRKPDGAQTDKRGFKTKREAEEYLAEVTVSKARGEYISPSAARIMVSALGPAWLENKRPPVMKPSAWDSIERSWRVHVEPVWGARSAGSIEHSEVQAWVTKLASRMSATSVLRAHGVLAGLLDVALKDRKLSRNVARGVDLPRKTKKPRAYLTHERLQSLAEVSNDPTLVLLLGLTGLRWGEATALRVRHLDTLRRRVKVEENAVLVAGHVKVGTPKSHEARSVPYPSLLAESLARACEGKGRDDLVFGDGATYMRVPHSTRGWFTMAVLSAQTADKDFPRVTPHDLRHTAASLAISAGANVKAVQRMLGHASAAMTLDTYADLFEDDLDAVSGALDRAHRDSNVGKMWARAHRIAPVPA